MKRNIMIMNIMTAFFWMSIYTYTPTLPAYATSIGATATLIGIIGAMYGLMQIIIRVPLGAIADKTGKNKFMLICGGVALIVSALILSLGENTDSLVWGRFMAGLAAAFWVIISSTYADYHSEEMQVKAQGVLSASSSIGKLVAALAGGIIAQMIGLKGPFYFALAVGIVSLALVFLLKETPPKTKRPSIKDTLALFKNKDVIILSVICLITQMISFGAATTFSQVAAENLGADSFTLGLLTVVYFGATAVFSFFVGSRVYKKIGGINCLAISFIVGAVSCVPQFYHINVPMVFFMQVLSGVCYGIGSSALAGMVIRAVTPENKGGVTGIFQSIYGVGILLGPLLAGILTDVMSFDFAYTVFLVICGVTALLCKLCINKKFESM